MALSDFFNKIVENPYITYNPVEDIASRLKGTRFDIPAQISALGEIFSRGVSTGTPTTYAATPQVVSPTAAQDERTVGTPTTTSGNLGSVIGGDFGTTSGAGTTGSSYDIDKIISEIDAQADRAADELIGLAQGNKDFAIRQLDSEHQIALGTGDAERAAFLEKVANKLEEKIGTIAYDYERDIGRLEENRQTALTRLREEAAATRGEAEREAERQRRSQEESLSERGMLSAPRERAIGLAGREVGELETEINAKFNAFERAIKEREEDIERTATRGREDVTTGARRTAGAAERTYTFGKEAAEKEFERQRREIELERERQKRLAAGYAIPATM
jgi:hypothetical protein